MGEFSLEPHTCALRLMLWNMAFRTLGKREKSSQRWGEKVESLFLLRKYTNGVLFGMCAPFTISLFLLGNSAPPLWEALLVTIALRHAAAVLDKETGLSGHRTSVRTSLLHSEFLLPWELGAKIGCHLSEPLSFPRGCLV